MPGINELVDFVASYQDHRYQGDADGRVNRWLSVFPKDDRPAIAAELAHVLGRAFFTREQAVLSVRGWLTRPREVSGGIIQAWDEATFLSVQQAGGSQRAVMELLDKEAVEMGLAPASKCRGSKLFVYVDDVSIHGMRILNDITPWLKSDAPEECILLLVLQRRLGMPKQQNYLGNELRSRAKQARKTLQVQWWSDHDFSDSDCYQPAELPDDPALNAYLKNRARPALRSGNATGQYFSSDRGRRLLESALLTAGVAVLNSNLLLTPRKYMRPLGNTIWSGLGLGVPIVTWRNCPNSAPLSLWADGRVSPLFPRQEN